MSGNSNRILDENLLEDILSKGFFRDIQEYLEAKFLLLAIDKYKSELEKKSYYKIIFATLQNRCFDTMLLSMARILDKQWVGIDKSKEHFTRSITGVLEILRKCPEKIRLREASFAAKVLTERHSIVPVANFDKIQQQLLAYIKSDPNLEEHSDLECQLILDFADVIDGQMKSNEISDILKNIKRHRDKRLAHNEAEFDPINFPIIEIKGLKPLEELVKFFFDLIAVSILSHEYRYEEVLAADIQGFEYDNLLISREELIQKQFEQLMIDMGILPHN